MSHSQNYRPQFDSSHSSSVQQYRNRRHPHNSYNSSQQFRQQQRYNWDQQGQTNANNYNQQQSFQSQSLINNSPQLNRAMPLQPIHNTTGMQAQLNTANAHNQQKVPQIRP